MSDQLDPREATLESLARACREQTERYQRREASDSRSCLEIFRRALLLANSDGQSAVYMDEAARELLVQIYTPFIAKQIPRTRPPATPHEDMVSETWRRFWQRANGSMTVESLPAALNYLKKTAAAVVIDDQRAQRKHFRNESLEWRVQTLGDTGMIDAEADMFPLHARRRFRQRCAEVLRDPLENRVFWMRYSLGMKPKEIAAQLHDEHLTIREKAPTAASISALLDVIFDRLKQDDELRDLLGE